MNGGVNSSIGASSATPQATLCSEATRRCSTPGTGATTNRGFTVTSGGVTIDNANALTFGGQVVQANGSNSSFTKNGYGHAELHERYRHQHVYRRCDGQRPRLRGQRLVSRCSAAPWAHAPCADEPDQWPVDRRLDQQRDLADRRKWISTVAPRPSPTTSGWAAATARTTRERR